MNEEIREDNNCIVKAFENNPISIITENIDDKKIYCFKASDIGKALNIVNIRTSITNFDGDEVVVRSTYDTINRNQDTLFLTSQGIYRLLYSSKKELAKKFRKWAGAILDDIIFNESQELKKQLEEQKQQLENKDKIIKQLENRPDTYGFSHGNESGYVYLMKDTSTLGNYKIGMALNPDKRLITLNTASSTYSLKIIARFKTNNKECSEKIIHVVLKSFRIKNRNDESFRFDSSAWFYIKDDFELAYVIKTIKDCISFSNRFNFKSHNDFKNININLEINDQLKEINNENILQKEIKQETSNKCKLNGQQLSNKTGNYKGIYWEEQKNKWCCKLKKDYKTYFLGYFDSELEAAIVYNDYALFINNKMGTNYALNEIPNYQPNPRDILEENKKCIDENKTSSYNGVSYSSKRQYYVVSIKHNGKTYNLGSHTDEIECAKLYNQQAMYFNQEFNTNYILNNIPNYVNLPKNIYQEIQDKKSNRKTSKYYGVTFDKQKTKYRAVLVHNKKQINLGFYENELDAAKAYNEKANELNKSNNKLIYKINNFN